MILVNKNFHRSDGRDFRGGDLRMTTALTIYGFGLRGSSAYKSTRKHRFRTRKPRKAL